MFIIYLRLISLQCRKHDVSYATYVTISTIYVFMYVILFYFILFTLPSADLVYCCLHWTIDIPVYTGDDKPVLISDFSQIVSLLSHESCILINACQALAQTNKKYYNACQALAQTNKKYYSFYTCFRKVRSLWSINVLLSGSTITNVDVQAKVAVFVIKLFLQIVFTNVSVRSKRFFFL